MLDIRDLITLKAQLSKAFHIQPSEIDRMPFWEFELYVKEIERLVKEENKQQEDEMNKYGVKDAMNVMKPGGMEKMTKDMMPKMPDMSKMGSMKMPSMGSMKMPGLK